MQASHSIHISLCSYGVALVFCVQAAQNHILLYVVRDLIYVCYAAFFQIVVYNMEYLK